MKKLFTFLLSACICTVAMAQSVRPEAVIAKAGTVKPVIDGVIDDVWANVAKQNVVLPFKLETPTLGAEGEVYWKGLWDENGMYILVVTNDDVWFPIWAQTASTNTYEFDKVELYFDTNYVLADGLGGQAGTTGNRQIAPDPTNGKLDGTMLTTAIQSGTVQYAYNVANPAWNVEFFIPWEAIPDKDGVLFDKTGTMGFDVNITDSDGDGKGRKRALWSNDGTRGVMDENWNNMDEAGHLTFDGAEALVYVDVVSITGGTTITANGGTLQLTTAVTPTDATNQKMKWTLTNGTGKASISSTGLVTPILNGTVTVVAAATDGGWAQSDPLEITISGQVLTQNSIWNTLNLVQNWNFNTDITSWGGWWDGATQIPPVVQDGVVVMSTDVNADTYDYHYQFNQSGLFTATPNIPYTVKFKSWSTETRTNTLDFEDTAALNYNRYGASTDPGNVGGRSEWAYTTTTDPTWFTFHVTFDQIVPTTVQKIQWLESESTSTVYLDSVLLISDADLALVPTANAIQHTVNSFSVSQLNNVVTVAQMASNITNVAIYNALGQKMMEKAPNGTMAKFNVNSLREGVYFVRLSDGSSQKFMK